MKRRSGSRRDRRQPEEPVFFVDKSLGQVQVAMALRQKGARVEIHDDHFGDGTEDTDWIPPVSQRGWVILSKDKRIRTRPLEKEAILSNGGRAFILTSGSMAGPEMAETFAAHLNKMKKLLDKQPRPFIATMNRSAVSLFHPPLKKKRRK